MGLINGLMAKRITQRHQGIIKNMNRDISTSDYIYANKSIVFAGKSSQQALINNIVVLLNGEIYNYSVLKKHYENKLHFLTKNSAEMIIGLYLKYGEDFLKSIEGEFALALFDGKKNKLLLAVDHIGIKPMYYYFLKNTLVFSSQISSLLKTPFLKREFNYGALYDCFTLGSCRDKQTLFRGINKITAGSILTFGQQMEIKKYYDLGQFINSPKTNNRKNISNISKIESLIDNSIMLRSNSSSKIGVSLSGGIDSGLLGYFLIKNRRDAYSLSLDLSQLSKKINENKFRKMAERKIESQAIVVTPSIKNPAVIMEKILSFLDDFAFHPALFAYYFLYEKAKENKVNVILSGDGLDELFLGYEHYPVVKKILDSNRKLDMFRLHLASSEFQPVISYIVANFLRHEHLFFSNHFYFNENTKSYLFRKNNHNPTERTITGFLDKYHNLEYLNQFIIGELAFKFRQTFTIIDCIASNLHIENRFPYMSKEIIDFAMRLSVNEKLHDGMAKYPIKKIAESIFSKQFAFRKKTGLYFPMDFFISKRKKQLFGKIIQSNRLVKEGYLSGNYIEFLFDGILKRGKLLPTDEFIIFFFLWFDYYFEKKNLLNYIN